MPRFLPDLSQRSPELERMDDAANDGVELREALRELRLINRLLGAARPTVEGVERLWRAAGRPRSLRILDVGAGSGDAAGPVLRWADRHGVELHVTLVDLHPQTCAEAATLHRRDPRVAVVCADLHRLAPCSADIVTAALLAHHFADAELADMLAALARVARLGVVVNDLQRHPLAWLGIRAATALLSRNLMIRHDAPLSVARGFHDADFERLRGEPGLGRLWYARRPLFRYLVVIPSLCTT